MQSLEVFNEQREMLFGIAYRMLGSVMDAEDVLQDAFLRWDRAPKTHIASPQSYLATLVTRLCIDQLRSARVQREQYIGPWLPEPLVGQAFADPAEGVALAESVGMAFLQVLERLAPPDRAAFLLHDVFDYTYPEIARILGKSEAYCRQMLHRARERVVAGRPRFTTTPEEVAQVTAQFMQACTAGDLQGLLTLLAPDVVWRSDGGGVVTAARKPIKGASVVSNFLLSLMAKAPAGFNGKVVPINGQPGIMFYVGPVPWGVLSLDVAQGRIRGIDLVVNPQKLRGLTG